jgi:hypothetical protein
MEIVQKENLASIMLVPYNMKSEEMPKGQLRHLLFHFGVQFENPYIDTYSMTDEVIDDLLSESEETHSMSQNEEKSFFLCSKVNSR